MRKMFKNLNEAIAYTTLVIQPKKLDKKNKDDLNKFMKLFLLCTIVPINIGFLLFVFSNNFLFLFGGFAFSSSIYLASSIKDLIETNKLRNHYYEKINNNDKKIIYFDKNYKSIKYSKEDEYCNNLTCEEVKYYEALKQQMTNDDSIVLPNNDTEFLNKDDAILLLINEINDMYKKYDFPDLSISSNEIILYYNFMYDLFIRYNLEDSFYYYMSANQQLVFANAIINNKKKIIINDYINCFPFDVIKLSKNKINYVRKKFDKITCINKCVYFNNNCRVRK